MTAYAQASRFVQAAARRVGEVLRRLYVRVGERSGGVERDEEAVVVHHDAHVTDSILFPGVKIGPGARVARCILDKNVIVPPGCRLGYDHEADGQRFVISERGIVVVPKGYQL